MRQFIFLLLVFSLSLSVFGQARRVKPSSTASPENQPRTEESFVSPEKLFDEANNYVKKKFEEFTAKKIPYNETLKEQTYREQRQLAAKYATQVSALKELSSQDFYYLGLLHVIAENQDGAIESLTKFLTLEKNDVEKLQTARFSLVMMFSPKKQFEKAENFLLDYQKNQPQKLSEKAKMESRLAKDYQNAGELNKASIHAEQAYQAYKTFFKDQTSRARGLQDILDSGKMLFEIHSQNNSAEKAQQTLQDLENTGISLESIGVYLEALNKRIYFFTEKKQKKEALGIYSAALKDVEKNFKNKAHQDELKRQLKNRERQYLMIGETAPELIIDRWLSTSKTLAGLRGKVVLLDFWATWCGPCIESFPKIIDIHNTFQKDGLEIIGVTRYYGEAEGMNVDNEAEFDFLKRFKKAYNLPYPFAVAKDKANHKTYGVEGIPTAVVIDRNGIIRYIHTGSGKIEELQSVIEKIMAEK